MSTHPAIPVPTFRMRKHAGVGLGTNCNRVSLFDLPLVESPATWDTNMDTHLLSVTAPNMAPWG